MGRQEARQEKRKKQNRVIALGTALILVCMIALVGLLILSQSNNTTTQNTASETANATSPNTGTQKAGQSTGSQTENSSTRVAAEDSTTRGKEVVGADGVTRVNGIVIVNKKHPLPATYAPGEDPTAKAQLLKLIADMQAKGYPISNNYSGYRSYQYQTQLYDAYVAKDGKAAADRYSARPGYSEHQTGLAFDIIDTSGNLLGDGGGNEPAVAYLAENAHRFGFIVRFTEEGESSTGYMKEAWHLRYVGDLATDIYESGKTLEQYLGVEGGDYAD